MEMIASIPISVQDVDQRWSQYLEVKKELRHQIRKTFHTGRRVSEHHLRPAEEKQKDHLNKVHGDYEAESQKMHELVKRIEDDCSSMITELCPRLRGCSTKSQLSVSLAPHAAWMGKLIAHASMDNPSAVAVATMTTIKSCFHKKLFLDPDFFRPVTVSLEDEKAKEDMFATTYSKIEDKDHVNRISIVNVVNTLFCATVGTICSATSYRFREEVNEVSGLQPTKKRGKKRKAPQQQEAEERCLRCRVGLRTVFLQADEDVGRCLDEMHPSDDWRKHCECMTKSKAHPWCYPCLVAYSAGMWTAQLCDMEIHRLEVLENRKPAMGKRERKSHEERKRMKERSNIRSARTCTVLCPECSHSFCPTAFCLEISESQREILLREGEEPKQQKRKKNNNSKPLFDVRAHSLLRWIIDFISEKSKRVIEEEKKKMAMIESPTMDVPMASPDQEITVEETTITTTTMTTTTAAASAAGLSREMQIVMNFMQEIRHEQSKMRERLDTIDTRMILTESTGLLLENTPVLTQGTTDFEQDLAAVAAVSSSSTFSRLVPVISCEDANAMAAATENAKGKKNKKITKKQQLLLLQQQQEQVIVDELARGFRIEGDLDQETWEETFARNLREATAGEAPPHQQVVKQEVEDSFHHQQQQQGAGGKKKKKKVKHCSLCGASDHYVTSCTKKRLELLRGILQDRFGIVVGNDWSISRPQGVLGFFEVLNQLGMPLDNEHCARGLSDLVQFSLRSGLLTDQWGFVEENARAINPTYIAAGSDTMLFNQDLNQQLLEISQNVQRHIDTDDDLVMVPMPSS